MNKFLLEKIFQLSSGEKLRKVMKYLGISYFAKKIFFKLFGAKNGRCEYLIDDIKALFSAENNDDVDYVLSGARFERNLLKLFLKLINRGDTVLDVGAAIGFYTVFIAKKVGHSGIVISLEPDSGRYDALCKNIKINDLSNVTALQLALGDEKKRGILTKRISKADLRIEEVSNFNADEDQLIDIMPGDLLIKEKGLKPNVIKIDVEGYEYSVIHGLEETLRNKACRLVCCEIHHNQLPYGITTEMALNLLKNCGFNKIQIYPHGNTSHAICLKE